MREIDKTIIINGEKIPVFLSPFTQEDYHSIMSTIFPYDKFGVLDSPKGKFKIYDFEKRHIPNTNYLFNMDFNFFSGLKALGLVVASFYAYRVATYSPSLPSFKTDKSHWDSIKKMSDIFPLSNPKIVYQGNGQGFVGESEE